MTPEHYARVKAIFLAVESVPVEAQQERLDSLCGGEGDLRRDVLKLLKHHDSEAATREGQTPFQQHTTDTIVNDASVLARVNPDKPAVSTWRSPRWRGATRWGVFLLASLILVLVAWLIDRSVRETSIAFERESLCANVKSVAAEVRHWSAQLDAQAQQWGRDPQLLDLVQQYLALGLHPDKTQLRDTELAHQLRSRAAAIFGDDVRYVLWNPPGLTLASWQADQGDVGNHLPPESMVELGRALNGHVQLQFPTQMKHTTEGFVPESSTLMWISFPIYSDGANPVAVMRVRDPDWIRQFQSFFEQQNATTSADTYCVDHEAHVLIQSRYSPTWPELGISPPASDTAIGKSPAPIDFVRAVDPGGRLVDGFRPDRPRQMLPLTEASARVTMGEEGFNINGYRDIRGERVIGAWQWIPERGLGIISETSYQRAYAFSQMIRIGLAALLLIPLGLTGLAWFGSNSLRTKQKLPSESGQRVGAYELLEKIGEGGMGYVFRARHSLLKRASAVKILRPDRLTLVDVGRFDREVKLAAQLTSPHTIRILDYGRTDDGLIYFAMEYLDGLTLSTVIARSGSLSASRTLHFLIQLCKSIEEAHTAGLIHRDIKPENIIITRRGNEADWLILFDFGLAKSVAPNSREFRTRETIWAGTPMFMSPERVRTPAAVDPRMDVYAIGAVGYFMLTGQPPFTTANPEMVFEQVLGVMPLSPSQVGASASIPALDAIVMRCLAKSPDDRPDSAAQLRTRLEELAAKHPWTADEANAWWRANSQPQIAAT